MSNDLLRLPFDQYQRYRMVADVLSRLRGGEPLRVLDVGGRTELLRRFVDDRVTIVDMEASDVTENMVLGDGSRLPFADDAFDVVCAFDTLEHVPPAAREAFVKESARVAKRWSILAGPYDQPNVAYGEELLQRFLKDKLGAVHRYLDEHRENGLPDRQQVTEWFESMGATVSCIGHGNLHRWLFMMCVELFLDDDPALRDFAGDVFAYYNEELYASDSEEPVYRHLVIASMPGEKAPDLRGLVGKSPDTALRDPLAAIALLTSELNAFDGERARFAKVEQELKAIAQDREDRIEEHEELGRELKEQLDEHREVLEARDKEVAEYRAGIEALESAQRELQAKLEWFPIKVLNKLRKMLGGD